MVTLTFDLTALIVGFIAGLFVGALGCCLTEMKAFDKLIAGNAELDDYFEYIERRRYILCVTGRRDD